jgi:signal transduction histidine kinase
MFRSLRNRLIFSHILPVILVIPLMGVAMVYVLETRLLLPMVYRNLTKEATLMAEITRNQSIFWQSGDAPQALVDGVGPYLSGRLSLLTTSGRVLASSDSATVGLKSQIAELPDLTTLVQGEVIQLQNGTLAEVFTPVFDLNNKPIGIILMTTQVVTVSDEVYQLRYLLGVILLFGLLAGIGLGSYLAFSINRPIQRVTRSIQELANGNWQAHVKEQGPDEMRMLAGEVNVLVDKLNSLEKARRQLLANLVHELGRPLGAIRSAIQALIKGAAKDPQLENDLLNGLDGETARLQRLLDDLAGLHDQVLGKLELERAPVKLGDWLINVLLPWEVVAQQKGVEIKIDALDEQAIVMVDSDRMAQAIGNLLSNAVKFTPAGGQISITANVDSERLIFQVADSGPGIPIEEQEKIFQPFYRGAHGRRIVQGMGLGLSIARDIVAAHGGIIELKSDSGVGSRFILQIPTEVPREG